MGTERVEAEPEGAERVEAEPEGAEPAAGRSVDQCLGPGWAFGGARHAPRAERAATLQPAPSDARVAPATTTHPLVALQQAAGNRAVADFVRARALAPRQVFAREPLDTPKGVTTASVDDAIKSGDPDKLKPLRPFPSLNLNQVRDISRLVIDKNWVVGPDDERTIELAWSALGGGASMAEADWRLWKECEDYGAELKAVPWLYEFRMTFAAKVRASALDSLDKNVVAIRAEAKRLGIGTRGEAAPAPTKESDDAVKEQAKLAQAVADAQARQKQLEDLEVGWDAPPSSDKSSAGGVQSTQQQKAKFNPHAPPHTPPRPEDGMADYQSVKANYDGMTRTIGSIVRQNPALYALTARDQMGTMKNADLAGARAELAAGLNGVLDDVAKTRANIESSSLGWQDLFPVQEKVLRGPEYQSAFNREAIEDAIKEAGGDAAAGAKLLSLVTLALITAVEVGTAGAATPVIAAVISLAASGASATMSWQEFSKLDTAAKATVSDDDAVVTKEQADGAKLAALMDTAIALIDVYGVGKAVTAARPGAKATVAALEGRVKNAATLRSELGKIGRGETVEGAEAVVKESVEAMGAAATVRSAGGWAALEKAVGANGTKEVGAWRDEVIHQAEEAALQAAKGEESEAARQAMALASGFAQAAVSEALDVIIEVFSGPTDAEADEAVDVGGQEAILDARTVAEEYAESAPSGPTATVAKLGRHQVMRAPPIVTVPVMPERLSRMTSDEFETIIRQGVGSGYFRAQGLPRMTVIDGKLNAAMNGYDGLGIAKEGEQVHLFNLECKHVQNLPEGMMHVPKLGDTIFGVQGGVGWNREKASVLLKADNEFAEDTLKYLEQAMKRRVKGFHPHMLGDALAGALERAAFVVFTPVWAPTHLLLAQLRGLARAGTTGMLIRIAPKGFRPPR